MSRKHSNPKSDQTLPLPLDLEASPSPVHSPTTEPPVLLGDRAPNQRANLPQPGPLSSALRVRAHRAALAKREYQRQEMDLGADVRASLAALARQAGMSKAKFAAFVLGRVLARKSADALVRAARRSHVARVTKRAGARARCSSGHGPSHVATTAP